MVLADDLISYWSFDSDATDDVGSNDGTVQGATHITSNQKLGAGAYEFEKYTTEYITVTDDATLDMTDTFTISFWVSFESSTTTMKMVDKGDGAYEIDWISNTVRFNRGNVAVMNSAALTPTAGVYYHVVCVRDGTNANIWINGVEDTGTYATALVTTATDLNFGRKNNNLDYLDGRMDEIGFWDRVLTDAEIGELYNSGTGLAYPFSASGTNSQINIGDDWKEIAGAQINIGDVWKAVEGMQVNIGDTWKTIF